MTNLEYLKRVVNGTQVATDSSPFNFSPPISKTLGFHVAQVEEGQAVVEIEAKTGIHSNPMGTIHGGVLCDIADAAIGVAHVTTLKEGETFTSIDLQINFFRPVWNERLKAAARPIHWGKTIARYVCDITKMDGKLVAQVTSTVVTLRGEAAKGR